MPLLPYFSIVESKFNKKNSVSVQIHLYSVYWRFYLFLKKKEDLY